MIRKTTMRIEHDLNDLPSPEIEVSRERLTAGKPDVDWKGHDGRVCNDAAVGLWLDRRTARREHHFQNDWRGHLPILSNGDDRVRTIRRDLREDRKSTRLNSSHMSISYAVFCLKK